MTPPLTPQPDHQMEPLPAAETMSTQFFGVLYISLTGLVDSMLPNSGPWSFFGQSVSYIIKLVPILWWSLPTGLAVPCPESPNAFTYAWLPGTKRPKKRKGFREKQSLSNRNDSKSETIFGLSTTNCTSWNQDYEGQELSQRLNPTIPTSSKELVPAPNTAQRNSQSPVPNAKLDQYPARIPDTLKEIPNAPPFSTPGEDIATYLTTLSLRRNSPSDSPSNH
ncbi:hypothetical protein DSO57_1010119 [Entomophthora muscae]|uniref:Uncharacterized protein n=1 Tax=Entomophthora muscae TaxID=34485 RepID=A0ACC2SW98_9FUNG|nr:hypothetical protein DSO57_1010119 [Entomophthora muscae]